MSDPIAEYVIKAKDDASYVLTQISGSVTDLRSGLMQMAAAAGPMGAVVVTMTAMGAAATAAGLKLADQVEQLDRLSSISGVSVENLQVMQRVLEEGGGDAQGLGPSLVKLNQAIRDGNPLLAQLQITSKDTYTAYMQLADVLLKTTDAKLRDEYATKLLGKAGAELIPDLQSMADNSERVRAQMERMGSLMTGAALDSARKLDAEVDQLKSSWADFATSISKGTLPVLANLAEALSEVTRNMMGMKKTQEELAADAVERSVRGVQGLSLPDQRKSLIASRSLQIQNAVQNPGNKMALLMITAFNDAIAKVEEEIAARGRGSTTPPPPASSRELDQLSSTIPFSPNDPRTHGFRTGIKGDAMIDEAKQAEEAARSFIATLKSGVVELDVAANETSQAALLMAQSVRSFTGGVRSDMSQLAADAIIGTTAIRDAWSQLIRSIISNMASSAADFGIGLLFDLIPIPGAGAVGGALLDKNGMTASQGGDTYNISALSARDVLQELTSPTGSLRGANDYVRTVSRASRR